MTKKNNITCDGNTAASMVAYAFSDVAAIYPITPSSPMGELADYWSAHDKRNIFDQKVHVQEMQSEAGASGAIHGSLSGGALTTTFTASQGLMLMLPNMFKIAGELLPAVFHVSSRSLAYQSLSIFGDHSDVMATRGTGFAMLASGSVQEAYDMAAIAHLSAIESRVPFLHFFDGFRTSHEIQKIKIEDYSTFKNMINMKKVKEFRRLALNPETPFAKVGAENPDVYFQGRERANEFYLKIPDIVEDYMSKYAKKTKRKYSLFDYFGSRNADRIIIMMGSGAQTAHETVEYMNLKKDKVGMIKVRLYRPFSVKHLLKAIPKNVKKIAVLDRTKESGSVGEPLYLDVSSAIRESGRKIEVYGGRYGLSSKEFTPSMVKSVFDFLNNKPKNNFTIGIDDDITKTSVKVKKHIDTESKSTVRCKFWGYGSDGTVSANKNSIKIIGENTDKNVQAYFSYDSKKSGGVTVSHLRFSDKPIKSEYLLTNSDFIALHKESYIGRYDILEGIVEGGIFLLNTHHSKDEAFYYLTKEMQKTIIDKKIKFYVIDASKISRSVGLGNRINTVMQTAFFKIAGIIPEKNAVKLIKQAIEKQFKSKGKEIVEMNWKCVDSSLDAVEKGVVPLKIDSKKCVEEIELIPKDADEFTRKIIEPCMRLKGDNIKVSEMTIDGSVPTATTMVEKRGVSDFVPKWIHDKCIQCGRCAMVCPHASIRIKQIESKELSDKKVSENFVTIKSNSKNDKNLLFRVQVYPEDCIGCTLCVEACPVKDKALKMISIEESRDSGENENQKVFDSLKDNVLDGVAENTVKGTQLKRPLFEFSGACGGCGETPYVKLVTQMFGEDMIIANATGCSSIFGGTFPTIPYSKNKEGHGPAWANSLFEDNAEYGYGMKLALDSNREQVYSIIKKLIDSKSVSKEMLKELKKALDNFNLKNDKIKQASEKIQDMIDSQIKSTKKKDVKNLLSRLDELKHYISDKSVWIIGGDGWAYDIGYGGLDHVLAQGKNVNVLVLDTEVYSNTGGQSSKATPIGASAKFAVSGKVSAKKNLGLMMMTYGNVYVASVSMGANMQQLVNALKEAEEYEGPSIVICYAPCINHGIDMRKSQLEEKRAVESGYWPLYRYNPKLVFEGKSPLIWESPDAKLDFKDFLMGETRFKTIYLQDPKKAEKLFSLAKKDAKRRFDDIKELLDKKDSDSDFNSSDNSSKDCDHCGCDGCNK